MSKYRIVYQYFTELGKPLYYLVLRRGPSRWGGYVKKNGQSMDSTGAGMMPASKFARSRQTSWYGSIEHAIRHIEKFEKGNDFEVEVEYDFRDIDMNSTQPLNGDNFEVRYSKIFKLPYVERNGRYMDKSGDFHGNACPSCVVNGLENMTKMKDSAWYKDLTHAVKTIVKVANGKNFTVKVTSNKLV